VAPSLRQRTNGKTKFLNSRTIKNAMKAALKKSGIKPLSFYQAGRHTFASQWVLSGNSIYRLKEIMGHSSVQVTERYAHSQTSSRTPSSRERTCGWRVRNRPRFFVSILDMWHLFYAHLTERGWSTRSGQLHPYPGW
jgi:hypothetical protein